MRQLDAEAVQMRQKEKKLLEAVKAGARLGDMVALSATAKQLTNTRASMRRSDNIKNKLQAMDQRFSDMKACTVAMSSMQALTACINTMQHGGMDGAAMSRIVYDFERANGVMDTHMDSIEEAMDDSFEPEQDTETRSIVELVLAEVGLDVSDVLNRAPTPSYSTTPAGQIEADLDARLANLKS